jgi:SAM-dependent methyltransferase
LSSRPDRFGAEPSAPARAAAELFASAGARDLLELGAGQGRDALAFALSGLRVQALDFSPSGVEAIRAKARAAGLDEMLTAAVHDCRDPLPFTDESFDACYSHMLYCMALTTPRLEAMSAEVRRILRPGGLQVYTVRSTADPDHGVGDARGDDMYEMNGFVVHFFSRELVERLAEGFELLEVAEFEEGELPRRLFRVTQRKSGT